MGWVSGGAEGQGGAGLWLQEAVEPVQACLLKLLYPPPLHICLWWPSYDKNMCQFSGEVSQKKSEQFVTVRQVGWWHLALVPNVPGLIPHPHVEL